MSKSSGNASHVAEQRGVAPTQTVAAAVSAMDQIIARTEGMPGIGVLSGPPGHGKTSALTYIAHPATFNSVYIACRSFETTKSLAQMTLKELGVAGKAFWSVSEMFDAICATLSAQDRTLVIDEADHIAEKMTIEFLRDLHDNARTPILLVGEEYLQRKLLRRHERFHDRVLVWAKTLPADAGDLAKLQKHYAPNLVLEDDAKRVLLQKTNGVARRIVTALHRIGEESKARGWQKITSAELAGVL